MDQTYFKCSECWNIKYLTRQQTHNVYQVPWEKRPTLPSYLVCFLGQHLIYSYFMIHLAPLMACIVFKQAALGIVSKNWHWPTCHLTNIYLWFVSKMIFLYANRYLFPFRAPWQLQDHWCNISIPYKITNVKSLPFRLLNLLTKALSS